VATCLGSVALASVTLVGASLLIGTPQAGAQTVTATLDVGSDPEGVAITPNSEYAYVTNEGSNYVNVINTTENTAATVDVGSDPEGVAITPNGADAYVVNNGSNTVSVIDTATNSVTATVNVGSYPVGVAITPNGEFAYVTNFYSASGEDTVSVIDTATNTVTATVNVGSGPENVAITPNGEFAYVTNSLSSTVSVIDTATNTVTAIVSTNGHGGTAWGVAISPNGDYAYVTPGGLNQGITVIDTATNKVTATIRGSEGQLGNATGVAFTPNGAYAYVTLQGTAAEGGDDVNVIDTASKKIVSTLSVGSDPIGIAITPTGTYAYVANFDSNTVSAISVTPMTEFNSPKGSADWIGYMQQIKGGSKYTGIQATFVVPTVTDADAQCPSDLDGTNDIPCFQESLWVGIGDGVKSDNVIQDGITINMAGDGGPITENAWSETPEQNTSCPGSSPTAFPCDFSLSFEPGDSITASVTQTSTGEWRMEIEDVTTGQSQYRDVAATTQYGTAEAIVERVNGGPNRTVNKKSDGTGPGLTPTSLIYFGHISYLENANTSWTPFFAPPKSSTMYWIPMNSLSDTLTSYGTGTPSYPLVSGDGFCVADGTQIPQIPLC
jgi:YVTN family beta-propeller protein